MKSADVATTDETGGTASLVVSEGLSRQAAFCGSSERYGAGSAPESEWKQGHNVFVSISWAIGLPGSHGNSKPFPEFPPVWVKNRPF